MSNKPAHTIMTLDEMISAERDKAGNRLYSRDTDATEKIQKLVAQAAVDLMNLPEKISLGHVEYVKSAVKAYLIACYEAGTIPSKIGCCRAMGLSRQAIDNYMQRNPDAPSSEFLRITFDTFASVLSDSALSGASNLVVAIFCLKALYSWQDKVVSEIQITNNPLSGANVDPMEIARKYDYLPGE